MERRDTAVRRLHPSELGPGIVDVVRCLFIHGPTWDGDIPSKSARDALHSFGYISRQKGWQTLTDQGLELALSLSLDREKESRKWKMTQLS